jgi:hypothetical protein
MARKAVQGFPEKSYFDNTRYLGMIATTDPLNEGFFKHIVNFDISDTGQSVEPRDGFISTTLVSPSTNSLSNKTIVFKNVDDNVFVLYDFTAKKGYLANIASYNLNNQYIPVETIITNFDWTGFINYLDSAVPAVRSYLIGSGYTATLIYVQSYLTIIPESKVEFIYDENGIRKTLVKAFLGIPNNPTITLTIQMYYRKEPITINGIEYETGNVLIFECVDNFLHPTLIASERNLSVSKSIIPDVFETLYTTATRPSGHVSNLGNFVYMYDNDLNYVNNFIFRNVNYNIRPYFVLNPAYLDLNNNINTSDRWAYRLEIFNTSSEISDQTKDTVMSSPWFRYDQNNRPVNIFSNNRINTISLGNANKSNNHYRSARYVIYVISKILNTTVSSNSVSDTGVALNEYPARASNGTYSVTGGETFNTIVNRNNSWVSTINTITDYKSFLKAIETLNNTAYFYIYDLHTSTSQGIFKTFDELMNSVTTSDVLEFKNMYHTFKKETDEDEYDLFLTADKLIEDIKTKGIFKNGYNVMFHLLPYAGNDTFIEGNKINTMGTNEFFGTQRPYYSNNQDNNPPNIDANTLPLGTIVQVIFSGQLYIVNLVGSTKVWQIMNGSNPSVRPFVSSTYGPVNSDGVYVNTNFFNNAIYKDTRTNKFYRWENSTGRAGQFTSIEPVTAAKEELRFVVASLNYFNTMQEYIVKENFFVFNEFEMTTYNWDTRKYELRTDLNTLKKPIGSELRNYPTASFESISDFGTQPPWYVTSVPTFTAAFGTVVQRFTGEIYTQQTNPSGNSWQTNSTKASTTSDFIQGALYVDSRTGFTYQWNNLSPIIGRLTPVSLKTPNFEGSDFFDKGVSGIFYMRPYEESEYVGKTYEELETLKLTWNATALTQTFNVQYGYDALTVTYIQKELTKEPLQILNSKNQIVFEDSRLLVWDKNTLYISEEGRYYWFKAINKLEFGEDIVKVLEYKNIILVFTTQHLYALSRIETITTSVNPVTNQLQQDVTGVAWTKQIVLYNLLVNKEYADVIQVFNQMVLFYSADGQLFMIKPNTMIDSETRFNIQYFNKAVNDVLLNYHEYMNERLAMYGKDTRVTKEQVKIKALVSINFIKMFYYVPGVMTYILIYDVVNNRYTVYDTLTFTNIFDKLFVESGDLYLTEQNNKLYFTMHYVEPNVRDNHVDITFTNNFKKEGINCLIDTGNLNINNHLNKRFRDLYVVFKNLNSDNLLFNLETHIDDIIAKPFYSTQLEIQEINGANYFITIPKLNDIEIIDINKISETATDALRYSITNNLFENNNVLMDFSEFTSSKLLTHRTSILGIGKVFRLKLQFISKGLYKLQHFGIIYKERRI